MDRCYNCGKPAMYLVGPEGQEVPLCLDCEYKRSQIHARQIEQNERMINFLTEQMEATVGMPGILPRFPERKVNIIQGGKTTFNNLTITGSNIGVLNTGNLKIVDSAISVLGQDPNSKAPGLAISMLANAGKANTIQLRQFINQT
jgi:hypothetical protein